MCGIPGILGAVDGSHVFFERPSGDNAMAFLNRHHSYSINAQAAATADGYVTHVSATFPGGTHDSRVFRNSTLSTRMGNEKGYCLLGDAGYPLRHNLITPIAVPTSRREERFNRRQRRGRVIIEQVFGWIKTRFQALKKTLKYTPKKAATFFVCSVILHNMIHQFRKTESNNPMIPHNLPNEDNYPDAREFRSEIVRQYC